MKLWEKFLVLIATAVLSILATFAYNGTNAVSRPEVETLVERGEVKHEAKMDLIMDRLSHIEIGQARLEEKVDALHEAHR